MKKFLTVLFLTGLLTASIAAAENSAKTAGTGKAILGISPHEKDISIKAVTADGSPVQAEGNSTDWNASDGLQAAIKRARAKNWTIYKQIVGGDFEELEPLDSVRD